MAKKAGFFLMVTGIVMLCISLYFFFELEKEESLIEETGNEVLKEMAKHLEEISQNKNYVTDPYSREMKSLMVDGYEYVGCLSIPSLEIELPVMNKLDEYRLKLAPCLYSGALNTDDMIIGAHNYKKHFANLIKLVPGDKVVFTSMDGNICFYQVISIETLMPQDLEKLTDTDYALTLFTCTYGGRKRTIVRCERER